ncbi:hypothetical protein ES708_29747 [subsurface metagenome]
MIGKPITSEEFQGVLNREESKQEFRKQLEEELKGIKPGECLLYEVKEGMGALAGAFAEMSFSFFVDKIGGLKMIVEGSRAYVYREKMNSSEILIKGRKNP